MSRLADVNLIAVLEVYLVVGFIVSVRIRYRQYKALLGFIVGLPSRWPRLFDLAKKHRTVFLTWPTLLPVALTFLLMAVHSVAYNFIWPAARVTPLQLWGHWLVFGGIVLLAVPMLYLDFDAIFNVWQFDRPALEKDLDQAEYWLRSWVAPTLRILTFGFINPRQMVHDEVKKALTNASRDLNKMMWRWSLQIAIRLAFGLTLWLTWAIVLPSGVSG